MELSTVLPRLALSNGLIIVCMLSLHIHAFPTGAPLSACSHLMPVHIDGELQEVVSPYILLLNDTEYGAGRYPLKLTITTVGPHARNFMAFMLQARSEFGQSVGSFSSASLPPASKTMTCYGSADTLTHTAAFIRPAMEVVFIPPDKNVGKISITGSIAVTKDKFWAVKSQPLKGLGKLDLSSSPGGNANALCPPSVSLIALLFIVLLCLI